VWRFDCISHGSSPQPRPKNDDDNNNDETNGHYLLAFSAKVSSLARPKLVATCQVRQHNVATTQQILTLNSTHAFPNLGEPHLRHVTSMSAISELIYRPSQPVVTSALISSTAWSRAASNLTALPSAEPYSRAKGIATAAGALIWLKLGEAAVAGFVHAVTPSMPLICVKTHPSGSCVY
jgi:hypothetical protein